MRYLGAKRLLVVTGVASKELAFAVWDLSAASPSLVNSFQATADLMSLHDSICGDQFGGTVLRGTAWRESSSGGSRASVQTACWGSRRRTWFWHRITPGRGSPG